MNLFLRKIVLLILFLPIFVYGQDSFSQCNRFKYNIEYTSELISDSIIPSKCYFQVSYNTQSRNSTYLMSINDTLIKTGKVLDIQTSIDKQFYLLEKYFEGKYNAKMMIVKTEECFNQKAAYLYYANQKDDINPKGTCHILFLVDP